MKKFGVLIVLFVCVPLALATPQDVDLHDYWDQRCSSCHGHSGEFARRFLRVESGRLVGVHHRNDLAVFLRNHYLTEQLLAPVSAMLMAQLTTTPLFAEKCAACHGSAAAFSRDSLTTAADGALIGRSSQRRVFDYLASHGGLDPREVQTMVDTLSRVRHEVTSQKKATH